MTIVSMILKKMKRNQSYTPLILSAITFLTTKERPIVTSLFLFFNPHLPRAIIFLFICQHSHVRAFFSMFQGVQLCDLDYRVLQGFLTQDQVPDGLALFRGGYPAAHNRDSVWHSPTPAHPTLSGYLSFGTYAGALHNYLNWVRAFFLLHGFT